MQPEFLKEIWTEICFILSHNIKLNVSENIYEQNVLRAIEKLGWRQFKKEIVIQPRLQIGRQGSIRPDLVIYGPEHKALIVIEVKRPSEDMTKDNAIGQLKSYMRQMKADFGLLVGVELRIYYDGNLNPQAEPLLLEKITFDRNSSMGLKFVEIFFKDNFLNKQYFPFLKETIGKFSREREVNKLKKILCSKETKNKIFELLKNEYTDLGQDIIAAAMENLRISLSYDLDSVRQVKQKDSDVHDEKPVPDEIHIYKNKSSGEKFIFIENLRDSKVRLITPQGKIKSLESSLFEEQDEKEEDHLLNLGLITPQQLEIYHSYIEDVGNEIQTPNGRRELGPKGYDNLKDYVLPVIKLMNRGDGHTKAFKKIAEELDVRRNTVSSQCTRGLGLNGPGGTKKFVSLVRNGEIVQLLNNKYSDRIELIEHELRLTV